MFRRLSSGRHNVQNEECIFYSGNIYFETSGFILSLSSLSFSFDASVEKSEPSVEREILLNIK